MNEIEFAVRSLTNANLDMACALEIMKNPSYDPFEWMPTEDRNQSREVTDKVRHLIGDIPLFYADISPRDECIVALIAQRTYDSKDQMVNKLIQAGAVKYGHFILSSGLHSDMYVNKYQILNKPELTRELCRQITDHFQHYQIDLVIGPTLGGAIVAYEIASLLNIEVIFAEQQDDQMILGRGELINRIGEKYALVVDDVLTTGTSLKRTIEAVERLRCSVVGAAVLVDRSNGNCKDLPLFSVCQIKSNIYEPGELPFELSQIAPQILGGHHRK